MVEPQVNVVLQYRLHDKVLPNGIQMGMEIVQRPPYPCIVHLIGFDVQCILQHRLGHPFFHFVQRSRSHQPVQTQAPDPRTVAHLFPTRAVAINGLHHTQTSEDGKKHWNRTR